jgi:hypothetical protein
MNKRINVFLLTLPALLMISVIIWRNHHSSIDSLRFHQRTLVTDWRFREASYQYFIGTNSQLPMRDTHNFEAISNSFMREKQPRYGAFWWSYVGLLTTFLALFLLLLPFIKNNRNIIKIFVQLET